MAGSSSGSIFFTASNRTSHTATLLYIEEGTENEMEYGGPLLPGAERTQETFFGHRWRLQNAAGTVELIVTDAADQRLVLISDDPEDNPPPPPSTAEGFDEAAAAAAFYKQSAEVGRAGLSVRASDVVAAGAVLAAADICREMLKHSPNGLADRLAGNKCGIAVIGRDQVTSDIPEHHVWASAASRPPPKEDDTPAGGSSGDAGPREADEVIQQRSAMVAALRPRLDACDASVLASVLCGLVERGRLSDAAVREALDRSEAEAAADEPSGAFNSADADAMVVVEEEAPPPASDAMHAASSAKEREAAKLEAEAEQPTTATKKRALSEIDATTRGVGGGKVTSVGEENLLDIAKDPHFRHESILVHEFGHTVMNIGMSEEGRALIRSAHEDAMKRGLYPPSCYMGSNADEYWAEGTQAWFDATVREDVNACVNSRSRLKAHDPALALLLKHAYGDGPWRFTDQLKDETKEEWRRKQTQVEKPTTQAAAASKCKYKAAAAPVDGLAAPQSVEEEDAEMQAAIAASLQ